jgi:AcrR family transcriptional regulator
LNSTFIRLRGTVSSVNAMSNEKRKYELKARAESRQRTREGIVRATMELHREVGPAKTTVAEIARRAGVQRLTVYNHFPEDAELFGACQAHWIGLHPLPDFSSALARPDPADRVRAVLTGYYGWYRETAPMAEKVQRDRGAVPALDDLMAQTADQRLDQLTEALAGGFRSRGRRAQRRRALIRLALDFWTWRRLDREGLDDAAAADLMAELAAAT